MSDTAQKIGLLLAGFALGFVVASLIDQCPGEACISIKRADLAYDKVLEFDAMASDAVIKDGFKVECVGENCETFSVCTVPPPG